jgi:Na+-transporting NADH:ubiquinone oxidoreductase subunit C
MNTNSNLYTFLYASVMVVLVAAILSFLAIKLQPVQDMNIKTEKMQDILASVKIESTPENAREKFEKFITKKMVVNSKGQLVEGIDAFEINLKQQFEKEMEERNLPVYEASLEDGSKKLIFPLRGTGLWGPIWGYISLNDDMNTIFGAVFDHAKETPGLGADINQDWFQDPFVGKKIFKQDELVGINVYKGGKGAALAQGDTEHGVDGISGGTITSNALDEMILLCLSSYKAFLIENKK